VLRDRDLRTMIVKAIREHEADLARTIVEGVDPPLLAQWRAVVTHPHESGTTVQSWLGEAPAKHSSRQIEEVIERIELLTAPQRSRRALLNRYARLRLRVSCAIAC
jgi:hypothetical protein